MKNLKAGRLGWARVMAVLWLLGAVVTARGAGLVAAWGQNTVLPPGVASIKAISAGQGHNVALTANGTLIAWGDATPGVTNFPTGFTGFRAISAGAGHSLALRSDGTVLAWGMNNFGQTNVPTGLSGVVAVAAGGNHSLALLANGTVTGWGDVINGQLNFPAALSNVIAISAGDEHSLALTASGNVIAWGSDVFGQTNVPDDATNVVAVAAGSSHSLALTASGNVIAWGDDSDGQCDVPVGLSNVIAIAGGEFHSLALTADGTVVAWGDGLEGETNIPPGLSNVTAIAAGLNDCFAVTPSGPVQILQAPTNMTVLAGSNVTLSVAATGAPLLNFSWSFNGNLIIGAAASNLTLTNLMFSQSGIYAVSVGNAFGSVLFPDATISVLSPPIVVTESGNITNRAGANITLFVTTTGTTPQSIQWQFNGTNISGATNNLLFLANTQPSASGQYLPVVTNPFGAAPTVPIQLTITNSPPYFLTLPVGHTNFLGSTVTFTTSARGSTPLFVQWRFDGNDIPGATNQTLTVGPLGLTNAGFYNVDVSNAFGDIFSSKVPLVVNEAAFWGQSPGVPPILTNLVAISVATQVLGLRLDGTIALWTPSPVFGLTNVAVPPGISNVTAISAGGANLVLESNGTVVAFGTPTFPAQTNVPKGLSNIIGIAMGGTDGGHALALRSNGTVVAWGGTGVNSPLTNVPPGLSNVIAVAAGGTHSMALRADGTVVAWGFNSFGQTNVPANLSNVIAIAAGTSHSLALKSDGTVVGWGSDATPPGGLSDVVAISAGNNVSIALSRNGSIRTWGANPVSPPDGLAHAFAVAASSTEYFVALANNGSPFITIQPASGSATNGGSFKLESRAVGVQPLSYQWLFNGEPISDATNVTLLLSNINGSMEGAYSMVASNSLGAAKSATATVTIPLPTTNLAVALNATNFIWTTGPQSPWFVENTITHDGVAAAQSGHIGDSQSSALQTTVIGPGTLTFFWMVSSEEDFDFLEFFIDNSASPAAEISGEVNWEQETFSIPSGTHTLRWVYSKDPSVSDGLDAGWVDQVSFPANSMPAAQPVVLNPPAIQPDGSLLITSAANGQSLQPGDASHFTILTSTDMVNWSVLTNAIAISNGSLSVCDTCRSNGARFYRIVQH